MSSKTQTPRLESLGSRLSSRFVSASVPDVPTYRVGVIGLGRIGRALVARLSQRNGGARDARFLPVVALVRRSDPERRPEEGVETVVDPDVFFARSLDVVVEATGAVAAVRDVLLRALRSGVSVVTANKALVAAHGPELAAAARDAGVAFRFEASAAAGIPIFAAAEAAWRSTRFRALTAILNGTTHFVLDQVAHGVRFGDAVREARVRGFAEPDATDDYSGLDAARKAVILAREVLGWDLSIDAVERVPVDETTVAAALATLGPTDVLKPIVRIERAAGRITARATPAALPVSSPLATLFGAENGIVLEEDDGTRHFLAGPGAGAGATSGALIDDLLRVVGSGRTTGEVGR